MNCGVDTIARGDYCALKESIWRAINPLVIGTVVSSAPKIGWDGFASP